MERIILVADCGATSCEWRLIVKVEISELPATVGFNPTYESTEVLKNAITSEPKLVTLFSEVDEIYYYGAGCASEAGSGKVKEALQSLFKKAEVFVSTDLWGSVRAVYNGEPVICGILGTGSNSCRYDGSTLVHCIPSLGFTLGDEGSGNHIGRMLLRGYYYREMPVELRANFSAQYELNLDIVLNAVYQQTNAAGYLAQFARFAADHLDDEYIYELVQQAISSYLHYYIRGFSDYRSHKAGMVGSIAFYFREILKSEAKKLEINLGPVLQRPIDELAKYHVLRG